MQILNNTLELLRLDPIDPNPSPYIFKVHNCLRELKEVLDSTQRSWHRYGKFIILNSEDRRELEVFMERLDLPEFRLDAKDIQRLLLLLP
jgi:3-deoxy-D-arabino-heptulosonate 7-phosphate (DAHP) synthase